MLINIYVKLINLGIKIISKMMIFKHSYTEMDLRQLELNYPLIFYLKEV